MRFFIFILSILAISPVFPQKINGIIHYELSDSEGLEGVRVEVNGFSTQYSDRLGRFSIPLPGIQRGRSVELDIFKEGYVVINREGIKPRIPDSDMDRVHLYMCQKDKRDKLAIRYYKIGITENIQRNYDSEAKILANKMNFEAIADLTEKKRAVEAMADSLAARLARFDPASASNELTHAMQLFQEGKIEEALAAIDPEKILLRIKARKDVVKDLQEANEQDIQSLMKAADFALTKLRFDKAQEYYIAAAEADTSNFSHLLTLCKFLHDQEQSDVMMTYADMLIDAAETEYEKATGYLAISAAQLRQNDTEGAIQNAEHALDINRKLAEKHPYSYTGSLAINLNLLGAIYSEIDHEIVKAIPYYLEAIEVRQNSSLSYLSHETNIADIRLNLGSVYRKLGRNEEALEEYLQVLEVYSKKEGKDPKRYQQKMGKIRNHLSLTYLNLDQYEKALEEGELSLAIRRSLAKENPIRFQSSVANNLDNNSLILRELKRYEEAIQSALKGLEIRSSLAEDNPQRFLPDVVLSHNTLVSIYSLLADSTSDSMWQQKVLHHQNQGIHILDTLNQILPGRYEPDLANAYNNKGSYLNKFDLLEESVNTYNKGLNILTKSPNYGRKEYLAIAEMLTINRGNSFNRLQKYSSARDSYLSAIDIIRQLALLNPEDSLEIGSHLNRLAFTYKDWLSYKPEQAIIDAGLDVIQQANAIWDNWKQPFSEAYGNHFMRTEYLENWFTQVDLLPNALDDKGTHCFHADQTDSAYYFYKQAADLYLEIPIEKMDINAKYRASFAFEHTNIFEKDPKLNYLYQKKLIEYREEVFQENSNEERQLSLANSHFNHSWYALFVEEYAESEASARRTLELSPELTGVISNLAASLLLQGKYSEAEKYYLDWKDEEWEEEGYGTFGEVFLSDLHDLQEAGVISGKSQKDADQLRILLE